MAEAGKLIHGENLTFSMLLKPNCNVKALENLTITIAEVRIRTIHKLYGYVLEIKYPNDIMKSNKKLAGILTESQLSGGKTKKIIIGIGLNLNQTEFKDELEDIATSLKNEFGGTYKKEEVIAEFLNEYETEYMKILNKDKRFI